MFDYQSCPPDSIWLWILPVIFMIIIIALIPKIFYIITLQRALRRCSPENRRMSPENVWLLLIPVFDLVWQFIVVDNMGKSLAAEFRKRDIRVDETEPGKSIGLAYCILSVVSFIPFVGILTGIASFVLWILYWIRIDNYSAQIAHPS